MFELKYFYYFLYISFVSYGDAGIPNLSYIV